MTSISNETLARTVKDYILGSDHPDLQVYRRNITDDTVDRWANMMKVHCQLGRFFNKEILEVGCGFGWDAVGLSLIGNNKVIATDILPSMIDGVNECLATQEAKGNKLNIEAKQGDICNIDLPSKSFGGIYSSEAVEHVHDLEAMFDRCYDLLQPGGRILIFNDSNQYNTDFREATFEMWKERDRSWEHAKWLESDVRPVEHKGAKPYAVMREEIIAESGIELDDASRTKLVEATAGLKRTEILEAVNGFMADGTVPVKPEFSWCRNPETGEYAERLLDPFQMAGWMKSSGFKNVQVRHAFLKFPYRLFNGVQLRPFNEWLFDKRAMFILVGDRPT